NSPGNALDKRLIIASTHTDAPGEAPSKAVIEPSSDTIVSVPNINVPLPHLSVSLISCIRCPAVINFSSLEFSYGIISLYYSIFSSFFHINCLTKYLVKPNSLAPADSIVKTLVGLTDANRSKFEPVFKNLGENPANGPNKSDRLPSI